MTKLEAYVLSLFMADQQWANWLAPLPDDVLEAIASSTALKDWPASRVARTLLNSRERAKQVLADRVEAFSARTSPPSPRGGRTPRP